MWIDLPLAAVMPVTNVVNKVWTSDESPTQVAIWVAVKTVANLWMECDECGLFCNEWEEWDVVWVWLKRCCRGHLLCAWMGKSN